MTILAAIGLIGLVTAYVVSMLSHRLPSPPTDLELGADEKLPGEKEPPVGESHLRGWDDCKSGSSIWRVDNLFSVTLFDYFSKSFSDGFFDEDQSDSDDEDVIEI